MKPTSKTSSNEVFSASHVESGIPVSKTMRIYHCSPDEWEGFTEEWVSSLKSKYNKVMRSAGAGDRGVDIAGFVDTPDFSRTWDNYQCKHYNQPLAPTDIYVEIGKTLYYSFEKSYAAPRAYYFIAPKGIGTKLTQLLCNPEKLKSQLKKNWDSYCKDKITKTKSIPLDEDLLQWVEQFDFSIFTSKTLVELIEEHSKTTFHATRFGGGLPPRKECLPPPKKHAKNENEYIKMIFDAYSDHLGYEVASHADIEGNERLSGDLARQRERFYNAESLRNFARDHVPEGTYEKLQHEIYHGVIDTNLECYKDGFARMTKTITESAKIILSSNPLITVVLVHDKQGICHQLASDKRLFWVDTDAGGKNDQTV